MLCEEIQNVTSNNTNNNAYDAAPYHSTFVIMRNIGFEYVSPRVGSAGFEYVRGWSRLVWPLLPTTSRGSGSTDSSSLRVVVRQGLVRLFFLGT